MTGSTHSSASAMRHSSANMQMNAPTIVVSEMSTSSGPWCASSVISNRSFVTRERSLPVRTRS